METRCAFTAGHAAKSLSLENIWPKRQMNHSLVYSRFSKLREKDFKRHLSTFNSPRRKYQFSHYGLRIAKALQPSFRGRGVSSKEQARQNHHPHGLDPYSSQGSLPLSPAQKSTIFAPATPPGKSAVGIIRIMGPDVLEAWTKLTRTVSRKGKTSDGNTLSEPLKKKKTDLPIPRRATLRHFVKPEGHDSSSSFEPLIDTGLVLYFPSTSTSPFPYPLLEFHTHGSPPVISLILRLLSDSSIFPTFRMANPGEFTMEALREGRMALGEVEALGELMEAETEMQREIAVRGAGKNSGVGRFEGERDGAMKGRMGRWEEIRERIVGAMGLVEAVIDFGEGEDQAIEEEKVLDQARRRIREITTMLRSQLHLFTSRTEVLRQGISLAVFGAPNAGKSSLINWLAQRSLSLVSPHAGTTRDVITTTLDFHGFPLKIADTAGLREINHFDSDKEGLDVQGEIERMGVEKAVEAVKSSHLRLCLLSLPETFPSMFSDHNSSVLAIPPLTLSLLTNPNTLFVINKTDLFRSKAPPSSSSEEREERLKQTREAIKTFVTKERQRRRRDVKSEKEEEITIPKVVSVSLKDGNGLEELDSVMKEVIEQKYSLGMSEDDFPLVSNARQRGHAEDCLASLETFLNSPSTITSPDSLVTSAEELRYACLAIGKLTGKSIDVEEVLGEVFRGFCIGK